MDGYGSLFPLVVGNVCRRRWQLMAHCGRGRRIENGVFDAIGGGQISRASEDASKRRDWGRVEMSIGWLRLGLGSDGGGGSPAVSGRVEGLVE